MMKFSSDELKSQKKNQKLFTPKSDYNSPESDVRQREIGFRLSSRMSGISILKPVCECYMLCFLLRHVISLFL